MRRVKGFGEGRKALSELRKRSHGGDIEDRVKKIIEDVRERGDEALRKYTASLTGWSSGR